MSSDEIEAGKTLAAEMARPKSLAASLDRALGAAAR
jgi:hypothetical protein